MNSHDLDYYVRRAEQERESAARSEDTIARRLHSELAERYHARVAEMVTIQPQRQAQG